MYPKVSLNISLSESFHKIYIWLVCIWGKCIVNVNDDTASDKEIDNVCILTEIIEVREGMGMSYF